MLMYVKPVDVCTEGAEDPVLSPFSVKTVLLRAGSQRSLSASLTAGTRCLRSGSCALLPADGQLEHHRDEAEEHRHHKDAHHGGSHGRQLPREFLARGVCFFESLGLPFLSEDESQLSFDSEPVSLWSIPFFLKSSLTLTGFGLIPQIHHVSEKSDSLGRGG